MTTGMTPGHPRRGWRTAMTTTLFGPRTATRGGLAMSGDQSLLDPLDAGLLCSMCARGEALGVLVGPPYAPDRGASAALPSGAWKSHGARVVPHPNKRNPRHTNNLIPHSTDDRFHAAIVPSSHHSVIASLVDSWCWCLKTVTSLTSGRGGSRVGCPFSRNHLALRQRRRLPGVHDVPSPAAHCAANGASSANDQERVCRP
jgi:hypothetical protein